MNKVLFFYFLCVCNTNIPTKVVLSLKTNKFPWKKTHIPNKPYLILTCAYKLLDSTLPM